MDKLSKILAVLAVAGVMSAFVTDLSATHLSEEEIKKRTMPVGKVYREGDDLPAAAAPAPEVATGPRSGDTVYNGFCMACHSTGAAGAPKIGDVAAWQPLLARGIDDLTASAIAGKNAMPARGTCGDCTDEEIKVAVEYMANKSQ
ncbi:MAG: c-type cytochrome [Pseudomonadota bacterium]